VHSACVIKDEKRRKDANLPGAAAGWRRRRWWRPVHSGRQTLLPLLCSFFYVLFFSVLDPSSLPLLPAAFSFSLLCFLEKKQRNEILFFLPLVSPGSVVPPLFLCPVFSVQDEENGDRMRYCWLMYQNFPWFCLSSSFPGSVFSPVAFLLCHPFFFFSLSHLLWLYSQRMPSTLKRLPPFTPATAPAKKMNSTPSNDVVFVCEVAICVLAHEVSKSL